MEIMEPVTNVGPHEKEHELYSDRLHRVVKSNAELKLQKISQHYEEKCQQLKDGRVTTPPIEQKRQLRLHNEKRLKNIKELHEKHIDIRTSNQATIVYVPKPRPHTTPLHQKRRQQQQQRQQQRREQEVQTVRTEIAQFETRKKLISSGLASLSSSRGQPLSGDFPVGGISQGFEVPGSSAKLTSQSHSKYLQDIRKRLKENAVVRELKEKRKNSFLLEQLRAQEAQADSQREEQLVQRLTRQTKQEQSLATQLLRIHVQKDEIQKNRLFKEQQYRQQRERDFQEALEREAALAQQAKLDCAEEIREELEYCIRIAAERAQGRFKKHSQTCRNILEQMVDLATKVGEYRLQTGNLIPQKQMREWKELLFSGRPLYGPVKQPGVDFPAPPDPVELEKQEILKYQDYEEYTNMEGEWAWPEEAGERKLPLTNNNILEHVVLRLRDIALQPVEPFPPAFPPFTIKACVMGNFCSGKTSCLAELAEASGINVISADSLIEDALNAYYNGEEFTEQQGENDSKQLLSSSTSLKSDLDTQEQSSDVNVRLSTRAMQGAATDKVLREGKVIPNELLVDIMVEVIKKLPAQSGWILDGFPMDITQACLLEKALRGSVEEGDGGVSSTTELDADPNPPEPSSSPPPALVLALLLDVPDESVTEHSFSDTETDNAAATTFHPSDNDLHSGQLPHKITAFQDSCTKQDKRFGGRQNILVCVDADVDEEELHKRVESVMQSVKNQTQEALADPPGDDEVLDSEEAPDSCSATPTPADNAQSPTNEAHTESDISPDEENAQIVKSPSNSITGCAEGKGSTSSTSSVTSKDSKGDPPKPSSPCPGSSNWVYVNEPLPPDLPQSLCSHLDTMDDSYVDKLKTTMDNMRSQQTVIQLHLLKVREDHYLGHPDLMQELVSDWLKDFTSIPDDNREDEDTKQELHLRLDELREGLWDIGDKHKEEDEKERAKLEGWLEKHTALLVNHYSALMQAELYRFQDTFLLLKVYYLGSCGEVLPVLPSKLRFIPLLHLIEVMQQDESTEPAGRSEDKSKTKPHRDSQTKKWIQPESVQLPHEKLISDYEEALTAIRQLVSAEAKQRETNEQESTDNQEVRDKIHKEYAAALDHEGNLSEARIALVKGHGLVMLQSLQSRAAQILSLLKTSLAAQYFSDMKSIDRLSHVVDHHIEAGATLQYEQTMKGTDFDWNGECLTVGSQATRSTPTATQLESLHRQLCIAAPSGLMSSLHFRNLLMDITSVNMGRNTLPEPWMNKNKTQLLQIASLLTDAYELIDWRRFLLSAALPWPFPSLSQLLVVLQRFKAADTDDTGFVTEDQYLQTELWFGIESVQLDPEDPSEPRPYDHLAHLHKFFFQLFADPSVSPPQLDYVYMLQYFAADPNPRQGFIRALSVVQGQHLQHSSLCRLVKSLPRIDELSSSGLDGDNKEEDTPCGCSGSLEEKEVSISTLLAVTCHKVTQLRDGSPLPPGCLSQEEHTEQLVRVFSELGYTPEDCAPFSALAQHPFIQDLMETSTQYQLVNIHGVLLANHDAIPQG